MLVFISDIHFTDGKTNDSMKPGAFSIFSEMLERIIARSKTEKVVIVMLGDILDLLRSNNWTETALRPWSDISQKDARGRNLENISLEIVRRIAEHPANIESVSHIRTMRKSLAKKGVELDIEYLPGNHDRLINLFTSTQKAAADFLGIERPSGCPFPVRKLWLEHRVFARHGDIHDPLNYDGKDKPSSLGDAIVIELVNRFPAEVKKELADEADISGLLRKINEIDNVRPLLDIPAYINHAADVASKYGGRAITKKVKRAWNGLAEEFIHLPFVTEHDRPLRWDLVNSLKAALFLSRKMTVGRIAKKVSNRRLRELYSGPGKFARHAAEEEAFKNREADFVVYGHTHREAVLPVGIVERAEPDHRRFYFNTGTWRKVFEKSLSGKRRDCFARRNVMTFICIFKKGERTSSDGETRQFETWTGSLA